MMEQSDWIDVEGARLYLRKAGTGSPLLLVHGTGTDSRTWEPVFSDLAEQHQVIVYDRRGYGRSEHPPVTDYHTHVADLAVILETIGPAHVLGWSSGGNVALALAVDRPELFRSLMIVEAPFHGSRYPRYGFLRTIIYIKLCQLAGQPERGARAFLRWASSYRSGGSGFDKASAEMQAHLLSNTKQIVAELSPSPNGPLIGYVDARRLASLRMPVTWMIGAESIGWYDTVRAGAARHAPQIQTVMLEGSGHLAHYDNPAEFVKATLRAASTNDVGHA